MKDKTIEAMFNLHMSCPTNDGFINNHSFQNVSFLFS